MTDDQIIAACATPAERRYLSGDGYDVSAKSYRYNRGEMLREIRERQRREGARRRVNDARRADLRERLRRTPDDIALHWEYLQVIADIERIQLRAITAEERRVFRCLGYSIAARRLAVASVPPTTLDEVHTVYEEIAHVPVRAVPTS